MISFSVDAHELYQTAKDIINSGFDDVSVSIEPGEDGLPPALCFKVWLSNSAYECFLISGKLEALP